MASPQPDKHTRFSNELLREIYRFPFSGTQLRVVLSVARHSYGWGRKITNPMGYRVMSKEVNMPRSSIQLALSVLIEMCVLTRDESGRWGINKDYERWIERVQPTVQGGPAHRTGGGQPTVPGGASGLAEKGQPTVPGGASGLAAYKEKEKQKERKKKDIAPTALVNPVILKTKELTPQQRIVRYFKEAKGIDSDDKDWDRKHWNGRLGKEANAVLKAFDGDWKKAGEYILIKGMIDWKDLPDWGLNGIAAAAGRDPRLNGENDESKHFEMASVGVDGTGRSRHTASSREITGDSLAGLRQQSAISSREPIDMDGPGMDSPGDEAFEA